MKKLPQGNCPFCDSERGLPSVWGMSPAGYGAMKDEHDAGHPNYRPDTEEVDRRMKPLEGLAKVMAQPPASEGWEEELRKDFKTLETLLHTDYQEMATWWIDRIRTLRQEACREVLEELATRTKKVMEAVSTAQGSHKYDSCYEDVLGIINQLKEKR